MFGTKHFDFRVICHRTVVEEVARTHPQSEASRNGMGGGLGLWLQRSGWGVGGEFQTEPD